MAHCKLHPSTKQVTFCPACRGAVTSVKKAEAARKNGKKHIAKKESQ